MIWEHISLLFPFSDKHAVNGNPTVEPFPEGMETIMFGEMAQKQFLIGE